MKTITLQEAQNNTVIFRKENYFLIEALIYNINESISKASKDGLYSIVYDFSNNAIFNTYKGYNYYLYFTTELKEFYSSLGYKIDFNTKSGFCNLRYDQCTISWKM